MDEQQAETAPKPEPLFWPTFAVVFRHALMPVGLVIFLVWIVPKFAALYTHFEADLPGVTLAVIAVSDFARKYVFALPLLVCGFLVLDVLVYVSVRRAAGKTAGKIWSVFVLLIQGAVLAAVVLGMMLAYVRLIGSIGAS